MGVIRRFVAEHLAPAAGGLVVAALDETGQEKKGSASAGVKPQYMGCAGQVANGVNTVHCSYATRGGHALIGARLYLPSEQLDDPDRRGDSASAPRWYSARNSSARTTSDSTTPRSAATPHCCATPCWSWPHNVCLALCCQRLREVCSMAGRSESGAACSGAGLPGGLDPQFVVVVHGELDTAVPALGGGAGSVGLVGCARWWSAAGLRPEGRYPAWQPARIRADATPRC